MVLRLAVCYTYDGFVQDLNNDFCSGTIYNPSSDDHSELDPPLVVFEEGTKSGDAFEDTSNAVVVDNDAGDSPILPFTASELDLLLEATTALLQAW